MNIAFYIAAVVAIVATFMVITRHNSIHALLYLIVSLLSVAVIFYVIGAPFVAALEVIIYAGAIMVLFIFVMMMLNLGSKAVEQESQWMKPGIWTGPSVLTAILIVEFLIVLLHIDFQRPENFRVVTPKEVGISLFSQYILGVELAGMLLMGGVIGAYHLGKKKKKILHRYLKKEDTA